MAGLDTYLAGQSGPGPFFAELHIGRVIAWDPGDKRVTFYGTESPIPQYDAGASIAAGDTVAALKVAGTYLVLCKIATA